MAAPGRRELMGSHILPPSNASICRPDCSCHQGRDTRTPVLGTDSPPAVPDDDDESTVSYEDAVEGAPSASCPAARAVLDPLAVPPIPALITPSGSSDMQPHGLAGGPQWHLNPEALSDFWSNIPVHLLDPFPPPDADEWVPGFSWGAIWAQANAAGIPCSAPHAPGSVCRFCQHSSAIPPFPQPGWRGIPLFGPGNTHAERCAWLGWPEKGLGGLGSGIFRGGPRP
eukprot:6444534-Heterocapsa_arctica.AAC.1